MAGFRKVIRLSSRKETHASTKRRSLVLACVLFVIVGLLPMRVGAAVDKPIVLETEWRTGEIHVSYTGVPAGYVVGFYGATHETPDDYRQLDLWVEDGTGSHTVKFLENGQTVWFYLVAIHPITGETSPTSNAFRQTPPLTAYIINWPDMFADMTGMNQAIIDAINGANQSLKDHIAAENQALKDFAQSLVTPSQSSMDNMKSAVDNLKNAVGVGAAETAAGQLTAGFNDIANNGLPKIVQDDGIGTYTGGSTPGQLPPLVGTANEATWCITYGVNAFNGNEPLKACLFTDEQMEKMKWWSVVYDAISVVPWILLGVWVVQRFTPQFKV